MNDDTPTPPLAPEIFSVFEFALVAIPSGTPRQSVKNVGEFASIEEAFATTLARARLEATTLLHVYAAQAAAESSDSTVSILATEWGYDIRHDNQTVTRFWIHAHAPAND